MAGMVHELWRFHGPSAQYFCMSFATSLYWGAALMDLLDECSGFSSRYSMLLDKTPE